MMHKLTGSCPTSPIISVSAQSPANQEFHVNENSNRQLEFIKALNYWNKISLFEVWLMFPSAVRFNLVTSCIEHIGCFQKLLATLHASKQLSINSTRKSLCCKQI